MRADWALAGGVVCPVGSPPLADGAVAVRGDRIAAVGPSEEVAPLARRVFRLPPGRAVVPGFNDSHQHLQGYVELQEQVQLWDARSVDDVLARVAAAARTRPAGEWVVAAGHDEGRLAERRHPTRAELDAAAPDHPVLVRRACSHVAVANSRALAAGSYGADTPDPPGGRLERIDGELTGVLHERAQLTLKRLIPPAAIDWPQAFRRAAADYHARGITSIGEASAGNRSVADAERLERAVRDGDLPLRVNLMARGAFADELLAAGEPPPAGDEWVRIGPVKLMADGVLAARTAFVSEPYTDGTRGEAALEPDELRALIRRAHELGFQTATHAIGDAAVELVLDAIERALEAQPRVDHRHRIEHVEVAGPGLAARMARAGAVGAIQTLFTHWSGDSKDEGVPEPLVGSLHPWGGLRRAGVRLCDGSDNPVVRDFSPLLGLHAAVTRRTRSGARLAADHALTAAQALEAATLGGAYATFEEDAKGSLAPGKLADLAVLSGDPLGDPEALPELRVELTAVGGRVVHDLLGTGFDHAH